MDETGKVIEVSDYFPYGDVRVRQSFENTFSTRKQFTGKEKDSSGLYYFGARYYDARLGRFTGVDPTAMFSPTGILADPQSLNLYAYARNNPLRLVDPNGLTWEEFMQGLYNGLIVQGLVNVAKSTKETVISAYQSIRLAVTDPKQAYQDTKTFFADIKTMIDAGLPKILSSDTYSAIYEYAEEELNSYWALDDYTRAQKAGELISGIVSVYAGGKMATAGSTAKASKAINAIQLTKGLTYSDKIIGQMNRRGWTPDLIKKTIKNPYKTGKSIDRANSNAPSTAYFLSDNQYVVVNDSTKGIVQVSNRTKTDWAVDTSITNIK